MFPFKAPENDEMFLKIPLGKMFFLSILPPPHERKPQYAPDDTVLIRPHVIWKYEFTFCADILQAKYIMSTVQVEYTNITKGVMEA